MGLSPAIQHKEGRLEAYPLTKNQMATVINTPSVRDSTSDGAAAGWAVAVVVLLGALLLALFVWPGFVRQSAPAQPTPNINVTIPGTTGETGGNVNGGGGAPTQ